MAGSCRTISWGLLLVALDIRIGAIDALPDIVGFLMIAFGLRELMGQAQRAGAGTGPESEAGSIARGYGRAASMAAVLAIWSVTELAAPPAAADGSPPLTGVWMIVSGAGQLLKLFMVHSSLTSLERQLAGLGKPGQAESVRARRRLYTAIQWLLLLAAPFSLNVREDLGAIMLLLGGAMLVMELVLFFTWRKAAYTASKSQAGGRDA
ncbi:hypothetical protein SAMN02799630_02353 [Paenibacillus sp. UNCCL117]|uniref:hypothetical protein n=1 Tax=unclassified Paenibacillus TaxID=185978 RepID=UPI00088AE23D|nr:MULTISPECIES: hypothetical protein [unclassified Paenibacillus]SDD18565.1 hypothetical protein SAMN04488602_106229 [Paenibacillus sp. cl123]SFW35273.1 hypothetical protein SAMN02799630_02353 [Paenibacillus sp. UNCCL117]